MRLTAKHMTWLGVGALWSIVSGLPAAADETELFIGSSTERPNILFILDNSGSMATELDTQETYNSATVYPAQGCSADRVYWRAGRGSVPDCGSNNWFNKTALMCRTALQSFGTTGFRNDNNMAQYDAAQQRWEEIEAARRDAFVECQDDNNSHGGPSDPLVKKFPQNGQANANNAWTNINQNIWGQARTRQDYTLYDGNYLNWSYGPTGRKTRLEVVQEVTTNLLNDMEGVNVGLMTFNDNQGGYVVQPMGDIATSRAAMQTSVNALAPGGWTPLSETLYEAALYYSGRAVDYGASSVASSRQPGNASLYKSPLELSCQSNNIVYLTDGEPTQDRDADSKIRNMRDANSDSFATFVGGSCDTETYPAGFNEDGGVCLDDLAEFLQDADLATIDGQQNINTYTIGFTVDLPVLKDTADRGGGSYHTANDTASLTSALAAIASQATADATTFTAPTVSVNSLNQTRNLDDVYISLFQPSNTSHWAGNLKKYRLRGSDATIVDANNRPAVDPVTGFFYDDAQDFWSATPDNGDITQGGAAHMIPLDRKVYTYIGAPPNPNLTDPSNRISKLPLTKITDALLGTGAADQPTREQVIDFINGLIDSDSDGLWDDARNQMGDAMNSQPTTVTYGSSVARVFFATNDGYLHSINTDDGTEAWAFLPPEFLNDQIEIVNNDPAPVKRYGIDGNVRAQIFGDSDGVVEPGEKVYLFFGMRRGGDVYYGLDVTNPDAPKVLWRHDSASLPGLGQSWATPTPTRISVAGTTQNPQKMALVIGGGYDPSQDNLAASTDPIGNSIYIIDSQLGTLLWHGSGNAGGGPRKVFNAAANRSMQYSIPADVNVVDLNNDGFADRMYASDMGGQVWRFDIFNGQPYGSLINGGVFAQLGSAPIVTPPVQATRRMYYAPDVAFVSNDDFNFIHVGIGSGHRAHPNSTSNQDRYYALRDYATFSSKTQAAYDAFVPITDAALVNVTDSINADVPQGSPGWKFELRIGGWRGEKVLAEGRTFDDKVFFNTYTPSAGASNGCTPALGLRRQYIVSLFNGGPVVNLDGPVDGGPLTAADRFSESNGPPPTNTEIIFLEGGDPPPLCVGLQCRSLDFNTNPIRTFWSQESID